ncbi:CST complex subunit STN1 isoform X3 [Amblyraja radiata]|uniref:CST complex subunit STN1 isoform X3 n=1 Tax=Amblyraja radiata TaxID=386614 RepID=UPI0014023EF1|nr:CST complex subunit STN1 isoform X3 [Amblyraja radiata]
MITGDVEVTEGMMAQSDRQSAEDPLPSVLWGLDPVHGVFAKLYIQDILQLKNSLHVPVDDGTGVISCVYWKKQMPAQVTKTASPPGGLNLRQQLSRLAGLEEDKRRVELGDVVRVRGRVREYREQREVSSISLVKVSDPVFAAQISRMLELPHLYRSFYDKTFRIPKDGCEADEQGALILSLQSKIKQFLAQNQVKNFYQRELETIDSLSCIARHDREGQCDQDSALSPAETLTQEPISSPCVSRQIHATFQEAVSALQEEGVIFQKVTGPNELYLVTDEEKQLHNVALEIIRDDCTQPKYIERGCPFRHILNCVRQCYGAGVTEATLQRLLDMLECGSQIVSTMDRFYTAC